MTIYHNKDFVILTKKDLKPSKLNLLTTFKLPPEEVCLRFFKKSVLSLLGKNTGSVVFSHGHKSHLLWRL